MFIYSLTTIRRCILGIDPLDIYCRLEKPIGGGGLGSQYRSGHINHNEYRPRGNPQKEINA